VVGKVRERSLSKHMILKYEVDRFSLNMLNYPGTREQYQVKTQTPLQLWTTSLIVFSLKGPGTVLVRILKL
jgi:hypothetical protein